MSKISLMSQPTFRDNTRRGICRCKLTEPLLLLVADGGSYILCSIIVATILGGKFFSTRPRFAVVAALAKEVMAVDQPHFAPPS